jgi:hypothetical protein
MKFHRNLKAILGVKGFLCLASLTAIALALVTYTTPVTITPTAQFTIGATTASWTIYVNNVNETRNLPSAGSPAGSQTPVFNESDTSTYAFKVTTDAAQVCAVRIELTAAANSSRFSKFEITAKYWNGSAWADEALYDADTGSTTKPYINGLTSGDAGFIHQGTSTMRYYVIVVTYSYDLVDDTAFITATFQYTPLPRDAF